MVWASQILRLKVTLGFDRGQVNVFNEAKNITGTVLEESADNSWEGEQRNIYRRGLQLLLT